MKKYLSDESFANNPPQVVVWELPERYLPVSYDLDLPIQGVEK
jgi:alginate O-acetyltransferase complex protein AlgJ